MPPQRPAALGHLPVRDRVAMFSAALEAGRVGLARKVATVDARPAVPGEVVVTVIAGEGVETVSPPATIGDWVVRNRVSETGYEQILVGGTQFARRYLPPEGEPDSDGFRACRPIGDPVRYTIVPPDSEPFAIEAPWGNLQRAAAGDVLVRGKDDPLDIYVVNRRIFAATYDVVTPAAE